jgi:hypothetical protein
MDAVRHLLLERLVRDAHVRVALGSPSQLQSPFVPCRRGRFGSGRFLRAPLFGFREGLPGLNSFQSRIARRQMMHQSETKWFVERARKAGQIL